MLTSKRRRWSLRVIHSDRQSLSRSVIYKHIAAIRAAFVQAGLDHYL